MRYDTVVVKQIPDGRSVALGLDKYKRSKMPSTMDFFQVGLGMDGRYITGLDENSYQISMISDPEKREELRTEKKNLREGLERLTSKDLSATSKFWEDFIVKISSDQDLILNRANPLHQIMYYALVANGYAAPDTNSLSEPQYLKCKYYCHVDATADREEISTQKHKDKARGELLKLSENNDKMTLIGQYLEGDKYKYGMNEDTLYKMLSNFINDTKQPDNLKKFLKAISMRVEDMQFKISIDRAVKKKLIVYKDKYFQRGQVTLGRSITELYENLAKPEFATEFLSIQEELEEYA